MEEWREIEDHPGYLVSKHGKVRGIRGNILKAHLNPRGYLRVKLWYDGVPYQMSVHTLVASAFIGPQPMGYDVHHKDENKTNNEASNLEYITKCEHTRGEANKQAKLTENCVRTIRNLYSNGTSSTEIGNMFNIHKSHVVRIINGEKWGHVL